MRMRLLAAIAALTTPFSSMAEAAPAGLEKELDGALWLKPAERHLMPYLRAWATELRSASSGCDEVMAGDTSAKVQWTKDNPEFYIHCVITGGKIITVYSSLEEIASRTGVLIPTYDPKKARESCQKDFRRSKLMPPKANFDWSSLRTEPRANGDIEVKVNFTAGGRQLTAYCREGQSGRQTFGSQPVTQN